jgi:hypothetical protein
MSPVGGDTNRGALPWAVSPPPTIKIWIGEWGCGHTSQFIIRLKFRQSNEIFEFHSASAFF